MPNRVPCPNDACDNGVIGVENTEFGSVAAVKTQCPKCGGTGWVIPSDSEEEEE